MPKYLIEASYSAEGAKGLIKRGGTARRAEVQKMVESLGGRLDAFYFVFGENDVHVILDLPENLTAAAISLAVMSTGAARMKTTVLLTPEEIDQAVKTPVDTSRQGSSCPTFSRCRRSPSKVFVYEEVGAVRAVARA